MQQDDLATPRLTFLLTWWIGWRPLYGIHNVRAMARMLREYVRMPFRVVLLTDQPATAEAAEVDEVLALPPEPKFLIVKNGINCFRRLRYFDPAFSAKFGTEWVISLDLDVLILENVTDVIETAMSDFGFSILRAYAYQPGARRFNGGMYAIRVGSHRHVWDEFDWKNGPIECANTGWRGSDQVWLSLKLPDAPVIGEEHGVYFLSSYQDSDDSAVPARMIFYGGFAKPWSKTAQREQPWLWQEYQRFL